MSWPAPPEMDDFSLSLVRGAIARGPDAPTNAKEWTAYLVDCSDAMYRTYRGPVPGLQGLTLFQAACSQIRDVVACRLAHAHDEEVAIVFFNRGVCVWHAAGPPTLSLLERLDDLVAASSVDQSFGQEGDRQGRRASTLESLRDAMVTTILEFDIEEWSNYKVEVSLVVAVWTADNTGACHDRDPAYQTVLELVQRRNIRLHVVLLDDFKLDVPRENLGDAGTVWAKLGAAVSCASSHNTRSVVDNPFAIPVSPGLTSHTDAIKMMRLSGTSRHTSFVVPWHVGLFGVLDVRFYSLTSPAWPRWAGSTKPLDARDSSVLVAKIGTALPANPHDSQEGDLPTDNTLLPFYPRPVGKRTPSSPRVVMTEDVVENLKYPVPFRRAFLIGFKPTKWLAVEWQMREAYFILPHEDASLDVRRRFKALHDVMVEQAVLAVCGFIKSEHSEPRLTAMLPCASKETGQALGFSMIELPFADDIRHPENEVEALGKPQHCPAMGAKCAEKLVSLHRVVKSELPGVAAHPQVRQHFAVIQSLLLDRPLEDGGGGQGTGAISARTDSSSRRRDDHPLLWAEFKRLHCL